MVLIKTIFSNFYFHLCFGFVCICKRKRTSRTETSSFERVGFHSLLQTSLYQVLTRVRRATELSPELLQPRLLIGCSCNRSTR